MFELTRGEINKIADEANFSRDMTEKVLRLYSVLNYISESGLGESLKFCSRDLMLKIYQIIQWESGKLNKTDDKEYLFIWFLN